MLEDSILYTNHEKIKISNRNAEPKVMKQFQKKIAFLWWWWEMEVPYSEIQKGYEIAKAQYVIIEKQDLSTYFF